MTNPFLADIEYLGKRILVGIEKAAPVIAHFSDAVSAVPKIGPALAEVAIVITNLEQSGGNLTAGDVEAIISTIVAASNMKTASVAAAESKLHSINTSLNKVP